MSVNISDLKAYKDSQGFYEIELHGIVVWGGYASSAKEAKQLCLERMER